MSALFSGGVAAAAGLAAWYGFPTACLPPLKAVHRAVAGLRPQRVTLGRHEVHYLAGGKGETVLLLHGIFGEKDHWNDFARALTGRYRVVVPDLPGFGASSRWPDERYDYASQVGRLAAFCDALGLREFHVAGSSMGGTLAALLALQRPGQVRSVAFIGAPHGLRTAQASAMDRLIAEGQAPLVPRSREEFEAMLSLLFARRPFLPYPVLAGARREALGQAESNLRLWHEQLQDRYLLQERLGALGVRTAAYWGEGDRLFDVSGIETLRRLLPGASLHVLPGIGHLPMMEAPGSTARLYARFLAGP